MGTSGGHARNQSPIHVPDDGRESVDFIGELRSVISDPAECDPGIIRKIMAGRSIASAVEDCSAQTTLL